MMTIVVDGRELRPSVSYSVNRDMLEPADAFSLTMPLDAQTAKQAPTDAPYELYVGDVPVMAGWLDEAEETDDGQLVLNGLDKSGRLVSTSVPGAGMSLGNTTVEGAIKRIVAPWFDSVIFSNAENRRLSRGRGRKSRSGREPGLSAAQRRQIPRRIDAGQKRWEALMALLEPLRLLAWSSADGKDLIVASPQYNQAPQYSLTKEFKRSSVLSMNRRRSVADRYSIIEVSGSGRPAGVSADPFFPAYPGQKRPKYVNRGRIGVARDVTGDFQRQKRLFVVSEAMSQGEAQELAERTMGKGLVNAEEIAIAAPGHGQTRPGTSISTLYTFDTVARVRRTIETAPGDDTETLLFEADYLITRLTLASDRQSGETTQMTLSPVGAALS